MRRGLWEECWGAASGVATRTVSPGKARASLASIVSKASGGRGTRLTRRLPVAAAAAGKGAGVVAILVCVEAIVRCGLSEVQLMVALFRDDSCFCFLTKTILRSKFMPHPSTQNHPVRILWT